MTDNGPQFVSGEFSTFLRDCDIQHLCIVNYNLQEDAAVETFNKTLNHAVQAFLSEKTAWEMGICSLLMQYHSAPSSATGTSPAELFFGCKIRANFEPVQKTFDKGENNTAPITADSGHKCSVPQVPQRKIKNRGPY